MEEGIRPSWFMSDLYILNGHDPVPVNDVLRWGRWFEEATRNGARIVAHDHLGGTLLSTVFLGLNHNFGPLGPPLLFETALLNPDGAVDVIARFPTWDEAVQFHREHLARITTQLSAAPEEAEQS